MCFTMVSVQVEQTLKIENYQLFRTSEQSALTHH